MSDEEIDRKIAFIFATDVLVTASMYIQIQMRE